MPLVAPDTQKEVFRPPSAQQALRKVLGKISPAKLLCAKPRKKLETPSTSKVGAFQWAPPVEAGLSNQNADPPLSDDTIMVISEGEGIRWERLWLPRYTATADRPLASIAALQLLLAMSSFSDGQWKSVHLAQMQTDTICLCASIRFHLMHSLKGASVHKRSC